MNSADNEYHHLLRKIMAEGEVRTDRTGVGTLAIFGHQMRFNLEEGFPLLTTKKVWWKGIVEELLWILSGSTNVKPLQEKGVHIWDEWADAEGDLGPVYGSQWRSWPAFDRDGSIGGNDGTTIDQIADVIKSIRTNPDSRRHLVTAWNPAELPDMKLPPCHLLFQFDVTADKKLNCLLYQRSCDVFLGVPFNIASYALLTHMVAHVCGLGVGEFIWTGGNTHIYLNHQEQVKLQLSRDSFAPPTIAINPEKTEIDDIMFEDIELVGYESHPTISAEVAV